MVADVRRFCGVVLAGALIAACGGRASHSGGSGGNAGNGGGAGNSETPDGGTKLVCPVSDSGVFEAPPTGACTGEGSCSIKLDNSCRPGVNAVPSMPPVYDCQCASNQWQCQITSGGLGLTPCGDAGPLPPDDCESEVPSAAELAATPRADQNLEQLALKFSDHVTADQAVYDRLVRDVGAIRAQDPSVKAIGYFAEDDGKTVMLTIDAATMTQVRDSTYHAWDCLNDAYGLSSITPLPASNPNFPNYVTVALKGIYRLDLLGKQYAKLPGVKEAGPSSGGGDGSTICVTREQDTWHYVFDAAGGDCPAGCTEHSYTHFSTNAAGTVTNLGTPTADQVSKYASAEACK